LELGKGGEGSVYEVPTNTDLVAKVYHPDKITYERMRKLEVMLGRPPDDPMKTQGHSSIAWPVDLLILDGVGNQVAGFLMPRVSAMHPIVDYYDVKTRFKKSPLFTYNYLHRAARNLSSAVYALHERGYIIGDVNESNVMVSDTSLVTLVDTDSFQVLDPNNNVTYRCPVGKTEFTPPELQSKDFSQVDRLPEHDLFGLAVLIFQLLMEGTPPFAGLFLGLGDPPEDAEWIAKGYFPYCQKRKVLCKPTPLAPPFEALHPDLQHLFLQCFEDGYNNPTARPSAKEWKNVLVHAENALISCSVNGQHYYSKHLNSCPWCERTKKFGVDPFPTKQSARAPSPYIKQPSKFSNQGYQVPFPQVHAPQHSYSPVISFYSTASSIHSGQSTTLFWQVSNAQSVHISGIGPVPTVGSVGVSPTQNTIYTLTAFGTQGTTSQTLYVSVSPPLPVVHFQVSNNSINLGDSVTLQWRVSNANSVSINNGIGAVSLVGHLTIYPSQHIVYSLTAVGPGGTVTSQVNVSVSSPPVPVPMAPISLKFNSLIPNKNALLKLSLTKLLNKASIKFSRVVTLRKLHDRGYQLISLVPYLPLKTVERNR
jgi:serine/threonine protein kinase